MYSSSPEALEAMRVLLLSRSESSVRMDAAALRGLGITALTHLHTTAEALSFLTACQENPPRAEHAPAGTPPEESLQVGSPPAARLQTGTCRAVTPRGRGLLPEASRPCASQTGASQAGAGVDIIICDEQLRDAPASTLLYALARHTALCSRPVLVLTGSPASTTALRAAALYVLERPYTPQDLARMLRKAASPARRVLRPELFDAAAGRCPALQLHPKEPPKPRSRPKGPMTTSDWLQKGAVHLAAGEMEEAEDAFRRVLSRQCDHVEACLGLARVHRARQEAEAMYRALVRAAAAYARAGDTNRAEAVTAVLPEHMRRNLFAQEALALMEEERYRSAALSFLDAAKEEPGTQLHSIIARACLHMPRPEECMSRLCDAYECIGQQGLSVSLRKRLLAYQPYEGQGVPSWLDRYPRLKEAVSVVGYAAWAWKQA